ncbi:DNA pilot protein [Microvirus D_HF4_124]|nr:DNA pilot protein [Microvirus D_HF4_124]
MALLETGITAGTSLIGGVLGYFGQKSANSEALKRMREQNDFVERMWNKGNEYNTPYEQRKRYELAGINPYLALGNIQAGNAQGSVTPAPPAPVGNAGAFLGAGANQAVNAYLQNQLISSQVEKNLADADAVRTDTPFIGRRNEADIASTEANTENTRTKTELDRVNTLVATASLDRLEQMTPIEIKLMQANVENVTANTSLTKLQELIQDWEFKNIKPLEAQEIKARIAQSHAMIGYLVAQGRLSIAQAGLVARQTLTEITREHGMHIDNLINEEDYRNYSVRFWNEMDNKTAQTRYLKEQADKTDNDDTRAWVGLVMDGVERGASYMMPGVSGATRAVERGASRIQSALARTAQRRAAAAANRPTPPLRPVLPKGRGFNR